MRLFIAIPLSREMKKTVRDVQDQIRRQKVSGNFTIHENLHITLAFIGEYDSPERVLELLERISFHPFTIKMDRIGSFGGLWWTGFEDCRQLEAIVKRLRHALSDAGIPFDNKRFKAHVTILRKPNYYNNDFPHSEIKPVSMTVDHIALMKSDRGKNGMIYTELGTVSADI